jgi:excisionase family DNA binding protein
VEKLLTLHQLSELIQVSPRTIYEWTHINFVPHYKLPKGVRFKISEIEKWIKNKKVKGRLAYRLDL